MFEGKILAIQVAPAAKAPPQSVESVSTEPGRGLTGDRYAAGRGGFLNGAVKPDKEVTLIESEAIAGAARDYALTLTHTDTRRNLLTEGVPLNHLVGRTFRAGEVVLRGIELCEPCGYLEKMTQPGFQTVFRHRGGLRSQVITGGTIRVGDPVQLVE